MWFHWGVWSPVAYVCIRNLWNEPLRWDVRACGGKAQGKSPPQHTLSPTCREVYGTAGAGDCTEWMMHVPERPVRHTGKVSQTVADSG